MGVRSLPDREARSIRLVLPLQSDTKMYLYENKYEFESGIELLFIGL